MVGAASDCALADLVFERFNLVLSATVLLKVQLLQVMLIAFLALRCAQMLLLLLML